MKIYRTTATKIMTKASSLQDECLLALMDQDENVKYAFNAETFSQLLQQQGPGTWIYNQNQTAMDVIDNLPHSDGQQTIEIFQDTEGVFGLRAYRQHGKLQTPVTLELHD